MCIAKVTTFDTIWFLAVALPANNYAVLGVRTFSKTEGK